MSFLGNRITLGCKALARVIKNALFLRYRRDIRLNVGAGGTRINGYVNVDSLLLRETDLLSTLHHLPRYVAPASVATIYASHVFEHFSDQEVRQVFRICYRLLQPGGTLRISVPDIDKIVSIYHDNWQHFQVPGHAPWNGLIYGGQSTSYDFHKTGFNACWLTFLLREAGFERMEEYDAETFTCENRFRDSSLASEPFGRPISLNMIAYK